MALFSFQSGSKAVKMAFLIFQQSGNEAGRKRKEIFPVKQGKYRENKELSLNLKGFLYWHPVQIRKIS